MIEAKELTKEFLIPVKQPGMRGAIRQLIHGEYQRKVAVDHVNFKVEQGEAVAYIAPMEPENPRLSKCSPVF